jgi:hypothetical protein
MDSMQIPTKTPMKIFTEIERNNPKICTAQKTLSNQSNLIKKKKAGIIILPDFKIAIKYSNQNRMVLTSMVHNREKGMNPGIYGQLVFD